MMRNRRGTQAIELALTIPVALSLIFGIVDFSWLAVHNQAINAAVAQGSRTGAYTPLEGDPGGAAVASAEARWAEFGLGNTPDVTATLVTENGVQLMSVTAKLHYDSLTGFIPDPGPLTTTMRLRMEEQP